jgi:8-oxo-dGTP pyrophosphatase MutT (NUDIX family)
VNDKALERLRLRLLREPGGSGEWPRAAVLVPLDSSGSILSVVLTRRADHLRLHAGEVAFPGGKCDDEDTDCWHTAAREAEEEIGLPGSRFEPLGALEPLVTRTGIEVIPCVALLKQSTNFCPNPDEIDQVFEVPLAFFAQRENLHFDEYDYGGRLRRVPRYQWQAFTIWGITAAILVQLANLGFEAGLELEPYWLGGQDAARDPRSRSENN